MRKKLGLIFVFSIVCTFLFGQKITFSGIVKEAGSLEAIPNVTVTVENSPFGTITNNYGFYSITVNKSVNLVFSAIGYQSQTISIQESQSKSLDIYLAIKTKELEEVNIKGEKWTKSSESSLMSTINIPIKQIKQMPAFMGEKDVIKALQLLPGIQKGREFNTGLYVRGGGADQNLLLLDDAVVYNASHLFGIFSTFNGDAIKNVSLTKGGFPARYGGRLSSVIDLQMKDGDKQKAHSEFGIGLLSSRMTLEGPLKKGKASYLISARRTYSDLFLKVLAGGEVPTMFFYDLNAKINYEINTNNKIYLSGYFGKDVFDFYKEIKNINSIKNDGFNWGNNTATLRWNHIYHPKLFGNTSVIFTKYQFKVYNEETIEDKTYSLNYKSNITDFSLKSDFDYLPNTSHSLKMGFLLTQHHFSPSALVYDNELIDSINIKENPQNGLEAALYVEDNWRINPSLSINGGFRAVVFALKNKQYNFLEPRLFLNYRFVNNISLKASFSEMNQYVHLLSNSGVGLPTDLWVPSTAKIAPQNAQQLALGLVKDFADNNWSISLETYHKKMKNIINYKDGASFLLLNIDPSAAKTSEVDWQENVTIGKGESYGMELLLQRKTGRLNGWIGYTLSWTKYHFDELNGGKSFFPVQDRRHDISIVSIYKLSPKINLSATWVYGSGNFMRIPVAGVSPRTFSTLGNFTNYGLSRNAKYYTERNEFKAAPYHRLDFAIQFIKNKKRGIRTWEIGVYNVYNRVNPFYYEYGIKSNNYANLSNAKESLLRVGLAPVLPSFSYNFKF